VYCLWVDTKFSELEQSDNLQYNIKNLLNEYFAEYKVTIILSDHIRFKDIFRKILISSANLKLWTNANLNPVNLEPNLELMNKIFRYINPLFHFCGFWRGFQEIGEDSDFRENWQNRISDVSDWAIINKKLLNSIKSSLLDNRQKETLVNNYRRKWGKKIYFYLFYLRIRQKSSLIR